MVATFLVLGLALAGNCFIVGSMISYYSSGKVSIALPVISGLSLLCWVVAVFSVSGLLRGQDPKKRKVE